MKKDPFLYSSPAAYREIQALRWKVALGIVGVIASVAFNVWLSMGATGPR